MWNNHSENEHFKCNILHSSNCGYLLWLTLPKEYEAKAFNRKQAQRWRETYVLVGTVLYSSISYVLFCGKNIFYPFSYAVSSLFNKILNQTLNGKHSIPAKPHHQGRISMGGGSAGSGLLFLPPSVQLPETSSHSQLLFPARALWFSCCSSKLFKCFQSPTLIHGPKHIFSFLLFQTKQFAFLIKKRQLYL